MSDYTPTTDEVRDAFAGHDFDQAIAGAQFDRWLAEVERAAAEKAWWAAESAFGQAHDQDHLEPWSHMPVNPYRAAALGLTAGQEGQEK